MYRIVIFFVLGLFFSCGNKESNLSAFIMVDKPEKEIIEKEIVTIVGIMIEENLANSMLASDSDLYCVTVEFFKGDVRFRGVTPSDTVICFSLYVSQLNFLYEGYKGSWIVNGYPVAIFDKDNIGYDYYDESALIKYPLKKFEDIEAKALFDGHGYRRFVFPFKFKNGEWYYLNSENPYSNNKYGL